MPLSSRPDDPILDQIARDTFALFPLCHRCGKKIERFEDADVRIHVQRVVHKGACPDDGGAETREVGMSEGQMSESQMSEGRMSEGQDAGASESCS